MDLESAVEEWDNVAEVVPQFAEVNESEDGDAGSNARMGAASSSTSVGRPRETKLITSEAAVKHFAANVTDKPSVREIPFRLFSVHVT